MPASENVRNDSYDYVIVGSGAAGSVLAERLSADGSSVIVLEEGGSDRGFAHRIPLNYARTSTDHRFSTGYDTDPVGTGIVDRWLRGRVLGGSTRSTAPSGAVAWRMPTERSSATATTPGAGTACSRPTANWNPISRAAG